MIRRNLPHRQEGRAKKSAFLALEFILDISLLALEFTPGAGFSVSLPGVGGG